MTDEQMEQLKAAMRPLMSDAMALVQLVREAKADEAGALVPAIDYAGRLSADRARTAAGVLAIMVVGLENEAEAK